MHSAKIVIFDHNLAGRTIDKHGIAAAVLANHETILLLPTVRHCGLTSKFQMALLERLNVVQPLRTHD